MIFMVILMVGTFNQHKSLIQSLGNTLVFLIHFP